MKIYITASHPVRTMEGILPSGVPIEVKPQLGRFLIDQGVAVLFETKEKMTRPTETAGKEEPLSALPVAQASPVTTPNESEPGARKRGRPRKNAA